VFRQCLILPWLASLVILVGVSVVSFDPAFDLGLPILRTETRKADFRLFCSSIQVCSVKPDNLVIYGIAVTPRMQVE